VTVEPLLARCELKTPGLKPGVLRFRDEHALSLARLAGTRQAFFDSLISGEFV
jgi:hypothetical protein